jgi:hypothetical protein
MLSGLAPKRQTAPRQRANLHYVALPMVKACGLSIPYHKNISPYLPNHFHPHYLKQRLIARKDLTGKGLDEY